MGFFWDNLWDYFEIQYFFVIWDCELFMKDFFGIDKIFFGIYSTSV